MTNKSVPYMVLGGTLLAVVAVFFGVAALLFALGSVGDGWDSGRVLEVVIDAAVALVAGSGSIYLRGRYRRRQRTGGRTR